MASISEPLISTMEIIVDGKLEKLQYDKTIEATIRQIIDLDTGEYKAEYDGNTFSVFAADPATQYSVDEDVYVIVPQGDYSQRKIIMCSTSKNSLSYRELTDRQNIIEKISPSFHVENFYNFNNFSSESEANNGLVAGKHDSITIFKASNNTYHGLFQQYANEYDLIQVEASFRTELHDLHSKGNYGLKLEFLSADPDSGDVSFTMDFSSFTGDPYKYGIESPQSAVIQLQKNQIYGLKSITFFEEGFDYDHMPVYVNNQLRTDVENTQTPNIFVSDIQVCFVEKRDLTDNAYYLSIEAPKGDSVSRNTASIDLVARLIYQQEDLLTNRNSECQWFVRDLGVKIGEEGYNKTAGFGWREIPGTTANSLTLDADDIGHDKEIQLIVTYNNTTVLTAKKHVYNLNSEYNYELRQSTISAGDDIGIGLQVINTDTDTPMKVDWYVSYPDGSYINLLNKNSEILLVKEYLLYTTATFYCTVYDDSENVLGTLEHTIRNTDSEDDLSVEYIGEDIFKYDANGDITIENAEKTRSLQIKLSWKSGTGTSYKVTWLAPDGQEITTTPISPADSMINNLYVDGTGILHYNIKQKYRFMYQNNTLGLRIRTVTGEEYEFKKDILFLKDGDPGTNGTTYIAIIKPRNATGYTPLIYKDNTWNNVALQCYVYKDGDLINNNSNYELTYQWTGNGLTVAAATDRATVYPNRPYSSAFNSRDLEYFVKVQISINDKVNSRKTNLYVSYPLDAVIGNLDVKEIDIESIPSFIQYTPTGINPQFYSGNITFSYAGTPGEIKTLNNRVLDLEKGEDDLIYLKPASSFIYEKENGAENESNIGVLKCIVDNNNFVIHPIMMYLNTFGNEAINGWDGTSLELNEQGGYILAPQVGAGAKDSDNKFTGVVMGKDSAQDLIGLYGYDRGVTTFGLMQSGVAFFGSQGGGGRIWIDGQSATIVGGRNAKLKNGVVDVPKSGAEHGMILTLADKSGDYDDNDEERKREDYAIQVGKNLFTVDYYGDMVAHDAFVNGEIYAGSGRIGGTESNRDTTGWRIETNRLYSGKGTDYVALDSGSPKEDGTTSEYAIWAGHENANNASFSVKRDGDIFASGAIYARAGRIGSTRDYNPETNEYEYSGGWNITSNELSSGDGEEHVALNSETDKAAFWAGATDAMKQEYWDDSVKRKEYAKFTVTKRGDLYAHSAHVDGKLELDAGSKLGQNLFIEDGKDGEGIYNRNGVNFTQVGISVGEDGKSKLRLNNDGLGDDDSKLKISPDGVITSVRTDEHGVETKMTLNGGTLNGGEITQDTFQILQGKLTSGDNFTLNNGKLETSDGGNNTIYLKDGMLLTTEDEGKDIYVKISGTGLANKSYFRDGTGKVVIDDKDGIIIYNKPLIPLEIDGQIIRNFYLDDNGNLVNSDGYLIDIEGNTQKDSDNKPILGFFDRDNLEPVFEANNQGNLTITGKVTARSGEIGNWKINDDPKHSGRLESEISVGFVGEDGDKKAGITRTIYLSGNPINDDKIIYVEEKDWTAGNRHTDTFYVDRAGHMYANSGQIATWKVDPNKLSSGQVTLYSGGEFEYSLYKDRMPSISVSEGHGYEIPDAPIKTQATTEKANFRDSLSEPIYVPGDSEDDEYWFLFDGKRGFYGDSSKGVLDAASHNNMLYVFQVNGGSETGAYYIDEENDVAYLCVDGERNLWELQEDNKVDNTRSYTYTYKKDDKDYMISYHDEGSVAEDMFSDGFIKDINGQIISKNDYYRIWAGSSSTEPGKADFFVTDLGLLHAVNAEIEGTIRAKAGYIGYNNSDDKGWTIAPNRLYSGDGKNHIELRSGSGYRGGNAHNSNESNDSLVLWAGGSDPSLSDKTVSSNNPIAPFRVTQEGILYATGAYISGKIEIGNGSTLGKIKVTDTGLDTGAGVTLTDQGLVSVNTNVRINGNGLVTKDIQISSDGHIVSQNTSLDIGNGTISGGTISQGNFSIAEGILKTTKSDGSTIQLKDGQLVLSDKDSKDQIKLEDGALISYGDGKTATVSIKGTGLSTNQYVKEGFSKIILDDNKGIIIQNATLGEPVFSIEGKDYYRDSSNNLITSGGYRVNAEGELLTDDKGNYILGNITTKDSYENVFYADTEGNLNLTGKIIAVGGQIGNWNINKDGKYDLSSDITVRIKDNNSNQEETYETKIQLNANPIETHNVIYVKTQRGSENPVHQFYVTDTGEVHADGGEIAGWTIDKEKLYKDDDVTLSTGDDKVYLNCRGEIIEIIQSDSGTYSISYPSAIDSLTFGGFASSSRGAVIAKLEELSKGNNEFNITNIGSYRIWAGHSEPSRASFVVTDKGYVFAKEAYIKGSITADAGYIGGTTGWVIESGQIYSSKISSDKTNYAGISTKGQYAFYAGSINKKDDGENHDQNSTSSNKYNFYVKFDGSLYASKAEIEGKITASEGKIGGWTIDGTKLKYFQSKKASNGEYISTNIYIDGKIEDLDLTTSAINKKVFYISARTTTNEMNENNEEEEGEGNSDESDTVTGRFYVTRAGKMVATNADINGVIKSKEGDIGGWTISRNGIYSGTGRTGMSSKGDYRFWVGSNEDLEAKEKANDEGLEPSIKPDNSDDSFDDATKAPYFYVESNGSIYARNATIKGKLIAGSGSRLGDWEVQSNQLYLNDKTYFGSSGLSIGKKTDKTAPFSVSSAGELKATGADISGKIHLGDGSTISWGDETNKQYPKGLYDFLQSFNLIDSSNERAVQSEKEMIQYLLDKELIEPIDGYTSPDGKTIYQGRIPTYITSTAITKTEIRSPKIAGGQFYATGVGNEKGNTSAYYLFPSDTEITFTTDGANFTLKNNPQPPIGWLSYDNNGAGTVEEAQNRVFLTTTGSTALKIESGGNLSIQANGGITSTEGQQTWSGQIYIRSDRLTFNSKLILEEGKNFSYGAGEPPKKYGETNELYFMIPPEEE